MDKQTLIEKIKAMAAAPSCCAELKAASAAYLDAVGTANEKSAAKNLIAEIEEDITTVENLVPFAHSETAVQIFGAEGAKNSPPMPTNSKLAARSIATASRVLLPLKSSITKKFFSVKTKSTIQVKFH